ncbi:hypothetical protein [Streptomyces sp. NPDC005408]|uniref:hypothetical protein n=1 Tax=Streptomyces sp. NPDC005408 TaxID=3155341 RepID=UPI0033AD4CD9
MSMLQRTVAAQWGTQGLDFVLLLLAEDVVRHAPSSARNDFARVVPEQALTPAQYEELKGRVLAVLPGTAFGVSDMDTLCRLVSDMDTLCRLVSDYLAEVERGDAEGQTRILAEIRRGQPDDPHAVREITLELAVLYSPDAHSPPSPPAT